MPKIVKYCRVIHLLVHVKLLYRIVSYSYKKPSCR